jgi:uncharacterized damage-inducible protein DinB
MSNNVLVKLFEHNHWANLQILQACTPLSADQLDAEPDSTTKGSIRQTLQHMMESQQSYWTQLAGEQPLFNWQSPPDFAELQEAAHITGEGLLALARDEAGKLSTAFQYDGYSIEPWVVMVQAINHSTEHREQIKSMLSALGVTPPRIDGWQYGRVANALTQITT